jgi:release factor glutamine methyltransferase
MTPGRAPAMPGAAARPSYAVREAARRLADAGVERPYPAAEILLSNVLGVDRAGIYSRAAPLSSTEAEAFGDAILRRSRGVPVQYVTGDQVFRELRLTVREGVFIPRPETEVLVDLALDSIADRDGAVVIDVGTGAGAVALAIASARRDARVIAIDVDPAAVELARENAASLSLAVDVRRGDLLEPAEDVRRRADLIVSNPPYLDEADLELLPPEVRAEPAHALAGGMELVARLADAAAALLATGGTIALETASARAHDVAGILRRRFADVRVVPDLTGRDRFVVGHLET